MDRASMKKLKILVVDDASFIRDLVKKTIKSQFPGVEMAEAVNGRKAQLLLARERMDLVLCDWEMPELSGIELLTWLRTEQGDTQTPFVMVTSRGDKANVVTAIQAGVTDYIGKPFTHEQLTSKVIKVLGRRHNIRELMGQRPVKLSSGVAQSSVEALTGKPAPQAKATTPQPAPQAKATATPPSGAAALSRQTGAAGSPSSGRPAEPSAKRGAQAAPAAAPPSQKAAASNATAGKSKGSAWLRVRDQRVHGVIKSISLRDITLVVRSADGIPLLLEQAVVDLQQGEGDAQEVARLNGYIHSLQAMEPKIDSALVSIVVHFVDRDPQKLDYLSRLIARGTTSVGYVPGA